jgi:hypothetical protein
MPPIRLEPYMNVILRVLRLLTGGCRHPHLYRERRELHGAHVLHWVCEDCGYAVPAIRRTPSEYQRVAAEGAIRPAHVQRMALDAAGVVGIEAHRRARSRDAWRRATAG